MLDSSKLREFDIHELLNRQGVEWSEDNKNVSDKCVGVCCPSCPGGDTNFHLGIFKDTKTYVCWKCAAHGNLVSLCKLLFGWDANRTRAEIEMETVGPVDARTRIREALGREVVPKVEKEKLVYGYPEHCLSLSTANANNMPTRFKRLAQFLKKRKFTSKFVMARSSRLCIYGRYSKRLILRIEGADGEMVGFQARDLTGTAAKKYDTPPHFAMHDYLYGQHRAVRHSPIILVEGIFDCWRHNYMHNVLAIFGTKMSKLQRSFIAMLRPTSIVVALDSDAHGVAVKMARSFGHICASAALKFDEGEDPDSTDPEDFMQMIHDSGVGEQDLKKLLKGSVDDA